MNAQQQTHCRLPPVEWNDTYRAYPDDLCVQGLVDEQARRSPENIAAEHEGQSLTYHELVLRADQVARLVRNHGVVSDAPIGVCMERSLELVVALLGVLRSGRAYVPLDPDYPNNRLTQMIEDAQLPIVLTQQHLQDRLKSMLEKESQIPSIPETLCVDSSSHNIAVDSGDDDTANRVKPTDLAYVIYTSGSTGRPKGAMNTHRGICNRLLWMQDEYQLGPDDAVLQKTPTSFDVSVWEFFWPLITGARLVLARPRGHLDSTYLKQLIQEKSVTVVHFVPSMLRVFLQDPNPEQCRSLRHVICSGEALTTDLQCKFFDHFDAKLHNLYGPTEAAVDVTYWQCQRNSPFESIPIGRPVANTQIHLLNDRLDPVPIGEPGELHIGGVQVARGYLNQPELTAEKFIPDPFSEDPEARLYKTGDLARYLPDGNIEFLGRIDHQVKIRGFRIELGEIETVLAEHPALHHAVVTAHDYGQGDRRLVAYVVPEKTCTDSKRQAEIIQIAREWVHQKLPEFMTPSVFVFLDEVPKTPNGKVDRKALPAPSQSRPSLDEPLIPPRTPLERRLTKMWCEILRLDEIGIHDRFFELGGDSIRAAWFVNALQEELREFIYVVTVFESPTVAQYAVLLERDYANTVAVWLGTNGSTVRGRTNGDYEKNTIQRVDEAMVQSMRNVVPLRPGMPDNQFKNGTKNPRAIFILAPPRSGTTLLRVMLAGHQGLFAATELQLLSFNTLAERKQAFTGKFSAWLDGTIRAIMELKQCGPDEAKQTMREYENRNCSTKEFYRALQEWCGERVLLDKSPHYALDPNALRMAECEFQEPFYIHLVRHPHAMVRSFEKQHMEQVLFLKEHDFDTRQLGELVWTLSHRETTGFLREVDMERQFLLRFEDLVSQPKRLMESLCKAMGFTFHAELLDPYKDQDRKMVDGVYEDSTPMGDVNFHAHGRIEPAVADQWKQAITDDFLGDITWELADTFGYKRPDHNSGRIEQWEDQLADARERKNRQRRRLAHRARHREVDGRE